MRPSVSASNYTHSTWAGAPSEAIICMLLDTDGRMLPIWDFSLRWYLFQMFSAAATVFETEWNALILGVR